MDTKQNPTSPAVLELPHLVGIGASAGGLEAITQLIGHLKPELPFAYVILQHLSPSHRSMMVEILGRETSLRVKNVEQGDVPQAGVIYVVPSNFNALYRNGRLNLVAAPPEVVPKPSVNQFFISLAAEAGDAAIGIVLSGTGSDGAAGLRAIQAAGGFTFAQKPESAKYDGMPRSAIEAGVADHVLTPEEIAARLPKLLDLPALDTEVELPPDLLQRLLGRLREKLQFDFTGYKVGTLMRRIRRREIATNNPDLATYIRWVENNPQELDLLARDILISVTAFFRDHDAFDALKRAVGEICQRKPPGSEIRVWCAGCASGEEAYSVAMLFAEALDERLPQYRVQIFATDIDDEALNVARRGVYPAAAMTEVPPEMLDRYFRSVAHTYEAGKLLRDLIVFARHNLVSDPPFLRLDLVSCRNVLIYFDSPLQSKVLQVFHFGLARDGYLFLGRSESVVQAEQLFSPDDRRERLFRKTGETAVPPAPGGTSMFRSPAQRRELKTELLLNGLVGHFGLTAVVCDAAGNIQHTVGEVDRFLQFPVGNTRLGVADAVVAELRGELLNLLMQCNQAGKPQRGRRRKLGRNWVRLYVEPISGAESVQILVLFMPEKSAGKEVVKLEFAPTPGLEDELVATREHLQTLVEEMATANEEMQALNEEAQASNEELQATNEELEAANEELQATNQELISVNEELSVKTTEYARLSEEYAHLYDSMQFPVLVFNREFELVRFNAPAERRFDLRQTALHQHVRRLRLPDLMADLEILLGNTLAHGDRVENFVSDRERTLQLCVAPGFNKAGEVMTLVVTLIDVSELARTQAALRESQARLSTLMENTSVLFAMKNLQGVYQYVNRRFIEFFDLDGIDCTGKTDYTLLPQDLAGELLSADLEALRCGELVAREVRMGQGEGARYLRASHQLLRDAEGLPCGFSMEAEDVTAQRHAEDQLRITARVFDQAGEGIVVTDAATSVQTVNAAFTRITGYRAEEAVGRRIGSVLKSGRHSEEFYLAMWSTLKEVGFWQGEIWNKRKNGEVYPEWLTINRIDNTEGQVEHYVAVFSDITSIKDSQRKAEFLSTHDSLTGLPNRSLFSDRLRHALAQARRAKTRVALLFIDLDNFKTINDTQGHDVGDELLQQAAGRLRDVVRDVDTVARLGGDEFTAIIADSDAKETSLIAQRIVDELSASFEVKGMNHFVSASVGIAFYPEDSEDSAGLVKAADSAMYRAKELGRNRIEFFMPELHVRLFKRSAIESGLREAMRKDRLRLVYQPKYLLSDPPVLVGAEALLRWQDPELGKVSPGEFIPVAEASGLILELGGVVSKLLFCQIVDWTSRGLQPPPIAFNVSPLSIRQGDFALSTLEAMQTMGVDSAQLQIEITEGALLENSAQVVDNLNRLHAAGVRIAIDDFGTGYSSLGYLKRLPLSELKIDKGFVDGLGHDKEDEAIARAVLGLAAALEFHTVAEGVETQQQLDWLREHGCQIVQGYLLSYPLEVADFEALIAGARDDKASLCSSQV